MYSKPQHALRAAPAAWSACLLPALLGASALLASGSVISATRPAPLPMLSGPTGAKPNVMLAVENGNRLAMPFLITYKISSENRSNFAKKPYCRGGDWQVPPLPGYGAGFAGPAGNCAERYKFGLIWTTRLSSPPAADWRIPIDDDSPWHAMRSADVNPVFYNPRLTYPARLKADGSVKSDAVDEPNTNLFVSNQDSANWNYCVADRDGSLKRRHSWREVVGMPASTRLCSVDLFDLTGFESTAGYAPWVTSSHNGLTTIKVPKLVTTTSPSSSTPAFTYAYCAQSSKDYKNIDGEPWNLETGCRVGDLLQPRNDWITGVPDVVNVTFGGPDIPLKVGHQRTDCAGGLTATKCTSKEEMGNIANWYRWYSTQGDALTTSIGRVLANPDYQDKMRLGYFSMVRFPHHPEGELGGERNDAGIGSGKGRSRSTEMRGVRLLSQADANNRADANQLYSWMYDALAAPRGTFRPVHFSVEALADYYRVSGNAESPWAKDPSQLGGPSNPELSCRRSFAILASPLGEIYSDGRLPRAVESKAWDRLPGPKFTSPYYGPNFDFKGYSINGDQTSDRTRKLYAPYGNNNYLPILGDNNDNSERLAKKTARYYWHEDLRSDLLNNIPPRDGQPIAWQNMTTYTVGYHMKPSREMANSNGRGLAYNQIDAFKRDWLLTGSLASRPKWPARDAGSAVAADSAGFLGNPRGYVDDFIQAGYTGGGAGFGVSTPAEVERAFDTIISEIINYRGNDAGVAVSGLSATTTETMLDDIKLTINYDLTKNSGLLTAIKLDQYGNNSAELWNSGETGRFPAVASRKFFGRTAAGVAKTINQSSTVNDFGFSALELPTGSTNVDPANSNFTQYLLGDDTKANKTGGLWRQRSQPMASSVNSAPLYIRARLNMGYANASAGVSGAASYSSYFKNKYNRPGTLYLATNQGLVHVFNAGDADKPYTGFTGGQEVGAYLLRGSADKLPKFADDAYKFQYMADGPLVEHDVYDGANWKNMVFGTLGRGGNGLFAFNTQLASAAPTPVAADYAWEKTAKDGGAYADLGIITNNPQAGINTNDIAMLISTAGHYGDSAKRGLYVLNPIDGSVLSFIETTGSGRGLSGVTLIRDAQKRITGAYAGDEAGNLWRFHLAGSAVTWGVRKIYSTGGLPIYAAPAWQTHPGKPSDACQSTTSSGACGTIVVIGTGILLDEDDQANIAKQRLVGIWDTTPVDGSDPSFSKTQAAFTGLTDLLRQEVKAAEGKPGLGRAQADTFYPVTQNKIDWTKNKGWYLDLNQLPGTTGERVIGDLMNVGSSVFATSVVIDAKDVNAEQCNPGPSGTVNLIYGVDALSGGLKRSFDQNGDGRPDGFSVVYTPAGGFTRNNALTQIIAPPADASMALIDHLLANAGGDVKEGKPNETVPTPGSGKAILTGTQNSIGLYDGLLGGWRRTWRPIVELPAGVQ